MFHYGGDAVGFRVECAQKVLVSHLCQSFVGKVLQFVKLEDGILKIGFRLHRVTFE